MARGNFGNPEQHAAAGRRSSGKFEKGSARTRLLASKGGKASPTQFKKDDARTKKLAREGGKH